MVFYSMRADDRDEVLQVLADAGTVLATLTMDDVRAAWEAQQAVG